MGQLLSIKDERTALIRLTALWALNEAGLGGLMHLFQTPFTGIFVGGGAVLLISLIGYIAEKPAVAIPKALLLVLIIKGMVSPHSPLTAYVAVAFQGILGAFLFSVVPSFRLAAFFLAVLALLESALQKLIVMTVLFGMPLWKSLDAFIDSVLQKFGMLAEGGSVAGSQWVVGAYLGLYLLCGMLIGWLAGWLPAEVNAAAERLPAPEGPSPDPEEGEGAYSRKPVWKKPFFKWSAGMLLALTAIYLFTPGARQVMAPLWLFVRVVGLIAVWYFIVGPFFIRLLRRFLKKKASEYHEEVSAALDLLPVFRHLSRTAWKETRHLKGLPRGRELAVRIITYALLFSKK